MRFLAWALLVVVTTVGAPFAQAYEPDPVLMTIQGYSPEFVRFSSIQRDRQEWKAPAPPALTPKQRVIRNFLYNDWLGSFDEFGYEIIREN